MSSYCEQINHLQQLLSCSIRDNCRLEAEVDDLSNQLNTLGGDYVDLQNDYNNAIDSKNQLAQILVGLKGEYEKVCIENSRMRFENNDLRKTVDNLIIFSAQLGSKLANV